MNTHIRCLAGALLLVVVAGCGQEQPVSSAAGPAAGVAAAQATTTTEPPAEPEGVPMSSLPVVGEGSTPLRGPLKMNAVVYEDTVYQNLGCGGGFLWVFDLNRSYTKLSTVIGLDDNSIADDDVNVRFIGDDGANLGSVDVRLGTVAPIELPISGVLRLRVEVTRSGGGCIPETGYGSTLGFGDAKLTKAS